jgi:hypothetical protein
MNMMKINMNFMKINMNAMKTNKNVTMKNTGFDITYYNNIVILLIKYLL